MPGRRIKVLRMTPGSVLTLLRRLDGLTYVEVEGMPADARAVGTTYDIARDWITILVESIEFDPVPEGRPVPTLDLLLNVPEVLHE
jgi:hypothetical protein